MPFSQQLLLIGGAVVILLVVIHSVHKRHILIDDSLFWIAFAVVLVVLGAFPQIVFFFARLFGFQSPANLVFAAITAVLIVKEFRTTAKLSILRDKVNQLAQEVALRTDDGQGSE